MTIRRQPPEVVQFTRESAERISRVVRESENAPLPGSPLTFDSPVLFSRPVQLQSQQKVFRICTFTGSWDIDTMKEVTFRNVMTTPNTLSATNLFFDIPDDGTKSCAVGKDGTAWYLIQWQWAIATCTTAAT